MMSIREGLGTIASCGGVFPWDRGRDMNMFGVNCSRIVTMSPGIQFNFFCEDVEYVDNNHGKQQNSGVEKSQLM